MTFHFWTDWKAIFTPKLHNWIDFTLIEVGGEISPYKDSSEVHLALFGFHVLAVYTWPRCTEEVPDPLAAMEAGSDGPSGAVRGRV